MGAPGDRFNSWGRVTRPRHAILHPGDLRQARDAASAGGPPVLPVGNGRSYGDTCLNDGGRLIRASSLDRFIALDPTTRRLRVEAGATLGEVLSVILPRGLFLPVTPGTQHVTVAGAVANDVHGKNHHAAGTLGRWVRRLELARSDGSVRELAPGDPQGLFAATVGGLGLTGLITWVELELAPVGSAQFEVETEPFGSLDAFWDLNERSVAAWPYTVAWIDCTQSGRALGRGVYSRGRHRARGPLTARPPARGLPVPLDAPSFLLSPPLLRAFNALYYGAKRLRAGAVVQHYAPFLYPLDGLSGWNRLYGRAGLYQYQLVVPWTSARPAIAACLREIARTGEGSFLAVLKSFGEHAPAGMLSFPRAGVTLALDFRNRGAATLALMARLDAIVMEAGGRLYPAKDGRMPAEVFRAGYPRWREFAAHVDPAFGSDFWRRVSS